jgi:hypothetical protein
MSLFRSFERGDLNIDRFNYAMIILIPKEEGAKNLRKFRPISLINCSFKIFAKALKNRLEHICDRLLSPNQTTFVKGKFILESVVSAHEIIHFVARNRENVLVLKLDYKRPMTELTGSFLKKC